MTTQGEVHRGEFLLHDEVVDYQWVRNRRRKHIHLVIDERHGLQVRTPWRTQIDDVKALLAAQRVWITTALLAHRERLSARVALQDGSRLPYLDQQLELRLGIGHRGRVARRGDQLVVNQQGDDEKKLRALLERWYREEALVALGDRLNVLAAKYDLRPSGLTIRAQRRRWGSCNSRGHINLNWRLMLMSTELVDYIIVHELCHLRHMNHSLDFWNLVERCMPDFQGRMARVDAIRGAELPL
jgi:predicted metal-dependent hydrolase